jgi:hypothetical protein
VQTTPVKLQGLPGDKRLLFLVAGGEHNVAVFGQVRQAEGSAVLGSVPESAAEPADDER